MLNYRSELLIWNGITHKRISVDMSELFNKMTSVLTIFSVKFSFLLKLSRESSSIKSRHSFSYCSRLKSTGHSDKLLCSIFSIFFICSSRVSFISFLSSSVNSLWTSIIVSVSMSSSFLISSKWSVVIRRGW